VASGDNRGVTPHATDPAASLEANKTVVLKFFSVFGGDDFDLVRALMDPNGTWWTLSARRAVPVLDSLRRIQRVQQSSDHGIDFHVETLTAEEDRVAAVVECRAEFAGRGVYNNLYHFLFRLNDGLIVETRVYCDTAHVNAVLMGERDGIGPLPCLVNDSSPAKDVRASAGSLG
jgi:ketosteroid isomerase-like protein